MGKYTPAQIRSKKKWLKKNREQLNVSVPIGTTDKVHEAMEKTGESKNKFVYIAIEERIASLSKKSARLTLKQNDGAELTDDQLENVAGGTNPEENNFNGKPVPTPNPDPYKP